MSRTATNKQPVCVRLAALAAVGAAAFALGACESPTRQAWGPSWQLNESSSLQTQPSYATGPGTTPETAAWTAERTYEYRGGRDPKTGRANIQM